MSDNIDIETTCPLTRTAQFDNQISDICDRRGSDYGHPYDDFSRAQALRAIVSECQDPHVRFALDMICVKMARLIESPDHLDSLVDIAGYARTAVMCLDRKDMLDVSNG